VIDLAKGRRRSSQAASVQVRRIPEPSTQELLSAQLDVAGIEHLAAPQGRRQESGQMLPGKRRIGRPRVVGPAELVTLGRLVDKGVSVTEAARTLKISRSTGYAALAASP
jgi:hypothetical protein